MKALFNKLDGQFISFIEPFVNETLYENSEYIVIEGDLLSKKQLFEGEEGYELQALEDVSAINAQILSELRVKRDALLKDSDFTQVADAPLSTEDKALWATYRQALRDLPENVNLETVGSLEDVVFPTAPGEGE